MMNLKDAASYALEQLKKAGADDAAVIVTGGKIDELNIDGSHSLRYINWHKKVEGRSHTGSPLTLNEEEYDDIINSGNFFCRKVHPDTSRKLLAMLRRNITKE